MEPLRGWSPRGKRLVAKVPHGHWTTMTFIAALRHDRIEAPWLAFAFDELVGVSGALALELF